MEIDQVINTGIFASEDELQAARERFREASDTPVMKVGRSWMHEDALECAKSFVDELAVKHGLPAPGKINGEINHYGLLKTGEFTRLAIVGDVLADEQAKVFAEASVRYESWTAIGEYIHLEDGDELCHLRGPAWSQDRNEARAKLMAAAPDMARLLEKLEHVRLPEMSFSRCPSCLSPCDLSQPHEAGCEWELALRKAGLR